MNIKHEISTDRKTLTLRTDESTSYDLRTMRGEDPDWGTIRVECDALDYLTSNSELQWVDPSETGDLTDAPMLGIRDENGTVLERWAFMSYAVRSFLEDLADKGEAVFTS